jgi:hypothetical protein
VRPYSSDAKCIAVVCVIGDYADDAWYTTICAHLNTYFGSDYMLYVPRSDKELDYNGLQLSNVHVFRFTNNTSPIAYLQLGFAVRDSYMFGIDERVFVECDPSCTHYDVIRSVCDDEGIPCYSSPYIMLQAIDDELRALSKKKKGSGLW